MVAELLKDFKWIIESYEIAVKNLTLRFNAIN